MLVADVGHAIYKTNERNTQPWFSQFSDHRQLTHIEPLLDSLSIHQNDFVIYWGDISPNTGLYLMNRRGWAQWSVGGGPLTEDKIEQCVNGGAKALIVDQNQYALNECERNVISKYDAQKLSDRNNVQIYSLRP